MAAMNTILFVPGAWHRAKCFSDVAALLKQSGYNTELIELPSVGPSKHLENFDRDVAVIRERVEKARAAGQKVTIVAHSYGGLPTTEAGKYFTRGEVSQLVYLASFIIPEGSSLISAFGGNDLPWFDVSEDGTEVRPKHPEAIFYNDMSEEAQANAVANLAPHSYRVFHSALTYAAWKHVPTTYVYCSGDAAIPLEIQKTMVERTAQGFPIRTQELDASHSPFLSLPRETADAIERAVLGG
ncbi:hypothetical protein DPSP01_011960 [Paraphaeosphaeria sporulosa]